MLIDFSSENYSRLCQLKRENVKSVMIFANALNKVKYDVVHEVVNIKVDDRVYLRLYQNYIILKLIIYKLLHQRIDFFTVFKKIDKFVFRLQFSSVMKIHSMISVT